MVGEKEEGDSSESLESKLERLEIELQNYKNLFNATTDIFYHLDSNGKFTYINDAIKKYGWDPKELIGKRFGIIIHPEDVERVSRETYLESDPSKKDDKIERKPREKSPGLFNELRSGEWATVDMEVRIVYKLGFEKNGHKSVLSEVISRGDDYIDTLVNAKGAKLQGEKKGTTGIVKDISEQKKAEELTLKIVNDMSGVIVLDGKGRVEIPYSIKTEKILSGKKKKPDKLVGEHYKTILPNELSVVVEPLMQKLNTTSSVDYLELGVIPIGKKYAAGKIRATRGSDGEVENYILQLSDITSRVRIEQSDKKDIASATLIYKTISEKTEFIKNIQLAKCGFYRKLMKERKEPINFFNVGAGSTWAPFSSDPELLKIMFSRGGNYVNGEYNIKIIRESFPIAEQLGAFKLMNPKIILENEEALEELLTNDFIKYLKDKGFDRKKLISIGDMVNLSGPDSLLVFLQCTFGKPFKNIPDKIFTLAELSLIWHHATGYTERSYLSMREMNRVMDYEGILTFCDGNGDMGYSERKTKDIMRTLSEMYGINVLLRDKHFGEYLYFDRRKGKFSLSQNIPKHREDDIIIVKEKDSTMDLPLKDRKILSYLNDIDFPSKRFKEKSGQEHVLFPLIDGLSKKDEEGLIKKALRMYKPTFDQIYNITGVDLNLKRDVALAAINEIMGYACQGRVEFYRPMDYMFDICSETGFKNFITHLQPQKNAEFYFTSMEKFSREEEEKMKEIEEKEKENYGN